MLNAESEYNERLHYNDLIKGHHHFHDRITVLLEKSIQKRGMNILLKWHFKNTNVVLTEAVGIKTRSN